MRISNYRIDRNGILPETVACCSVWKALRNDLVWYHLQDDPSAGVMPSLVSGFRVNYCPSCGAETRFSVFRKNVIR